ncbi:MAG: hypothetical protein PHU25_19450 [Deltaproteobacteria bacterium]|nr:hypothetical protein [Deltaproteobacteria bacterium]
MSTQFYIVKGFLEGKGSNLAGLEDFEKELRARYPGCVVHEFTQDKFDVVPIDTNTNPVVFISNSWGSAACYRWLDKHPQQTVPLLVCLDPVPNGFVEPRQDTKIEWRRRPNAGWVLSFREQDSIVAGNPQRPDDQQTFTGFRDDGNRFTQYEYGRRTEVVLDKDSGIFGHFAAHFEIASKHPWVKRLIHERIERAIEGWVQA